MTRPKSIRSAVRVDVRFVLPVTATVTSTAAGGVRLGFRTLRLRARLWAIRAFVRIAALAAGASEVTAAVTPVRQGDGEGA